MKISANQQNNIWLSHWQRTIFLVLFALCLIVWRGSPSIAAEEPLPPPEQAIVRVTFEPNSWTVNRTGREDIESFAQRFSKLGGRLEIRAYAGPPHDTSSGARRLSLRRALAVRQELAARGIGNERIYVRAFGGTSDSGPTERVDVRLFGR